MEEENIVHVLIGRELKEPSYYIPYILRELSGKSGEKIIIRFLWSDDVHRWDKIDELIKGIETKFKYSDEWKVKRSGKKYTVRTFDMETGEEKHTIIRASYDLVAYPKGKSGGIFRIISKR